MFRSSYNFILQSFAEINKIIAVTGNSYDQVAVFLRLFLRFTKQFGIHNVKLNMMTIQIEICSY